MLDPKVFSFIMAVAGRPSFKNSTLHSGMSDKINGEWVTKLSDETPGYVEYRELNEDPDEEEGARWAWGSLYVHTDYHKPGFYDFVFTYGGKIFAVMLTKFYAEEELYGKSNAELNKMMDGLSKK